MASITSPINVGMPNQSRRSYITTGTFHTDIFKYTTSLNASFQTVGGLSTLNALGAGTVSNCPVNRVLRENGRRLVPDANPPVSTVMVGVYDAISGLSGFIDPTSSKFSVYSTDKANWLGDGTNPVSGTRDNLGAGAGLLDIAYPSGSNINQDFTIASVYRVSTLTSNVQFSATAVPPAGKFVVVTLTNDNNVSAGVAATGGAAVNKTVSFLSNFYDEGDIALSCTSNFNRFSFTFVSDGSKLLETARNIGVITTTVVGES